MKRANFCLLSAILILAIVLSGCSEKQVGGQQTADKNVQKDTNAGNAAGQQEVVNTELKPSASATKIYLALKQAGVKEAVVDVQENEVVIGFMEDLNRSNEALAYFSFGLAAKIEPEKEKTTVLVFSPTGKIVEASVKNSDTIALSDGKLTDAQYNANVRWVK